MYTFKHSFKKNSNFFLNFILVILLSSFENTKILFWDKPNYFEKRVDDEVLQRKQSTSEYFLRISMTFYYAYKWNCRNLLTRLYE